MDFILIVVDKFTTCWKTMDTTWKAYLYFNKVICLHDIPMFIISYKDVKFMSNFWKSLWSKIGTQLNSDRAYHP
jgi:hypothetical protein